jgi:hypothetical protein
MATESGSALAWAWVLASDLATEMDSAMATESVWASAWG